MPRIDGSLQAWRQAALAVEVNPRHVGRIVLVEAAPIVVGLEPVPIPLDAVDLCQSLPHLLPLELLACGKLDGLQDEEHAIVDGKGTDAPWGKYTGFLRQVGEPGEFLDGSVPGQAALRQLYEYCIGVVGQDGCRMRCRVVHILPTLHPPRPAEIGRHMALQGDSQRITQEAF